LEQLRDQWSRATDAAEQKRLATEVQRESYKVVPYVIIGQFFAARAYRKNITGYIASPVPFFWNLAKE
jgi:peptide/nickel transport system substrate-binding protein